ncbi:MAG: DNA mismatch repair protein MutS, partial [Chloroflexi bacterium]|nr:DNA mismatch repair protein MutS [Chloroflexota bacterium]
LRRWLGQPLLDLAALEQRLEAVDSFYRDGLARGAVAAALTGVADMERIIGRVVAGSVAPRELLALRSGLETLPELGERVAGLGSGLQWLHTGLRPVSEVTELIEAAIEPEPSGAVGDGNVIRSGFSDEIDELKNASTNARQYIAGLEQKERERTGIRSLRVGYNQVFGYYIEVSKSQTAELPDDYIRRQTLTNAERYIVPELKEYESLVLNARERLATAESDIYRRICAQVAESAESVARTASAIAQVDVFCALAQAAVDNGYVRPVVDNGSVVRIREGRHPVVERVLSSGEYVPNDVELSGEERVLMLTGPNMAGKSTYIRQVALITLMAQVGSFVPAAEARIGLVDRIFTRVGLQDDLATGQSTFMVEMVETAAILNQATPRSLVILDEIGRGTSTYDGLSIARAVIEHLHNDPRLGCKTLFATHYHELTQLAATLPGVRNYSVAVAEEGGDVIFLHRIVPGGADRSYGVHVARLAGLPQGVINRAWEVLTDLESQGENARKRLTHSAPVQQLTLFPAGSSLADALRALDVPNMTPLDALNKLYELQEQAGSMA